MENMKMKLSCQTSFKIEVEHMNMKLLSVVVVVKLEVVTVVGDRSCNVIVVVVLVVVTVPRRISLDRVAFESVKKNQSLVGKSSEHKGTHREYSHGFPKRQSILQNLMTWICILNIDNH